MPDYSAVRPTASITPLLLWSPPLAGLLAHRLHPPDSGRGRNRLRPAQNNLCNSRNGIGSILNPEGVIDALADKIGRQMTLVRHSLSTRSHRRDSGQRLAQKECRVASDRRQAEVPGSALP